MSETNTETLKPLSISDNMDVDGIGYVGVDSDTKAAESDIGALERADSSPIRTSSNNQLSLPQHSLDNVIPTNGHIDGSQDITDSELLGALTGLVKNYENPSDLNVKQEPSSADDNKNQVIMDLDNNTPEYTSRLILLYGTPKLTPIRTQVQQFQSLSPMTTDIIEVKDLVNFSDSEIRQKSYHYLNICIEYNDEFEQTLKQINDFLKDQADFIASFEEIGYHIHFDGNKKWEDYSDFEKNEYVKLIEILGTYKSKVYHVSIINKYEINTIYLTEKDDLTRLGLEIQNDINNWSNLKRFDYSDNCIRFFPGVKFPDSLEVMNISGSYCIETLTGFKIPNNLKVLIASSNSITSIDNLKLPNKLETLNLVDNKIYFLNYIEFPESLKYLNLSNNRIDNIRGIEFPRNLVSLSLSLNPIDNIKGSKFPETLKYLDISCIPNDSMTGLKFPDLLEILNLQESMTNTRGLKLPNFLKQLNLGNNGVNSINPLKLPNTIETLFLGKNNIKTLNKVQFPMNLTKLYLGNNMITTLKNVVFPPNLEVLDIEMDPNLDENEKRISNLKDVILPNSLKVLKLGYQNIKVLENFEFPLSLEELDLSFNDLKLIKNIKFHNNLKILNISGNQELIEIDQFLIPNSLEQLMIPSQLIPNLPGYIIERANSKDLIITKSLPF